MGEADADLGHALPEVALLLGRVLPPRLEHLVGRERAALAQEVHRLLDRLVRRQRLLGHRLHPLRPVGQGPAERVTGTGLSGSALLVAVTRSRQTAVRHVDRGGEDAALLGGPAVVGEEVRGAAQEQGAAVGPPSMHA